MSHFFRDERGLPVHVREPTRFEQAVALPQRNTQRLSEDRQACRPGRFHLVSMKLTWPDREAGLDPRSSWIIPRADLQATWASCRAFRMGACYP